MARGERPYSDVESYLSLLLSAGGVLGPNSEREPKPPDPNWADFEELVMLMQNSALAKQMGFCYILSTQCPSTYCCI